MWVSYIMLHVMASTGGPVATANNGLARPAVAAGTGEGEQLAARALRFN